MREVFDVVDLHCGGEPLRVITSGFPRLPGARILDKRQYLEEHWDGYRERLMFEPWGHEDMYGCLLVEPERHDSLYGLIFMHNAGYSTMCGHATIAVTKMLVETGRVTIPVGAPLVSVKFDVPSGQIEAHARIRDGRVAQVWFENVPAFAVALDQTVVVAGQAVTLDIGFGGAYYAIVASRQLGLAVVPDAIDDYRRWGRAIKAAVEPRGWATHPDDARLSGIYGVIFTDEPHDARRHSRNLTIFADGQVDRSPCGSCLSARMAVLDAKGLIQRQQRYQVESVIGTTFDVEVMGDTKAGVRTTVEGEAYLTGFRRFFVNPQDAVAPFLVR